MAYQMLGLAMRGAEEQAGSLFSYVDLEARVPSRLLKNRVA